MRVCVSMSERVYSMYCMSTVWLGASFMAGGGIACRVLMGAPGQQNEAHRGLRRTSVAIRKSLGQFVLLLWENHSVWSALAFAWQVEARTELPMASHCHAVRSHSREQTGSHSNTQRPCHVGFENDGESNKIRAFGTGNRRRGLWGLKGCLGFSCLRGVDWIRTGLFWNCVTTGELDSTGFSFTNFLFFYTVYTHTICPSRCQ